MGPVICLELVDHIFDVETHGGFRDSEIAGNLFVSQTIANKSKNIQFTGGQVLMAEVLRQSGRYVGRNTFAAAVHLTDDIEQLFFFDSLEHVGEGACA
jgi:hypothetical protein